MKKLFIILLITFIFLNGLALGAGIAEEWEIVKKTASAAKQWLINHGLWTPIVNALNSQGEKYAKEICKQLTVDIICDSVVYFIFHHK